MKNNLHKNARCIFFVFLCVLTARFLLYAQLDMQTPPKPVKAKAGFTKYAAHPGGEIKLTLLVSIEKDWHIFGKNTDIGKLKPLTIDIAAPKNMTISPVQLDKPEKAYLEAILKDAYVYHDKVDASATVKVSAKAKPKRYFLEAKILYQACSKNLCLLPQTITLKIPLEVLDKNVQIDVPFKKTPL